MTRALRTWWQHLRVLATGTLQVWWRCLPALVCGLTLGLLGYQALLLLSAFISGSMPWLSVVTLSIGFACMLVGYLYCLRVIGRELAVGEAILRSQQGENLVDEPLSRLVAVALLPFIGIYAVFGRIEDTSRQLVTYEVITRGVMERGVLSTLNPKTTREVWTVLGVLLAAFVVRRTLDGLLERTGRRVFGILTGLVETFFTLVLIFGGTRIITHAKDWLAGRRVAGWWQDWLSQVASLLRRIHLQLPEWIAQLWHGLLGPVWQWFSAGAAEPLLWLAIAALAFGSRVMSASELWRETVGGRATPKPRPSLARFQQPGVQRAWTEAKELFFGDIDDKYLPTLQSLKLVLSAGASLVGAFCLLHAVVSQLDALVDWLLRTLVGPKDSVVWVSLGMGQDLLETLVSEPLRLALLGVTYLHCLKLLQTRSQEVAHD